MTNQATHEFRSSLGNLIRRRTHWLQHVLSAKQPGSPPSFTRRTVNHAIKQMQECASKSLANRLARTEFEDGVRRRKSWHAKKGKGRGAERKKAAFNAWFDQHFTPGPFIYAFWNRRKCVYVGKTARSGRRISSHFEKGWFGGVTRVDVYRVRGVRDLPALECLAMHRFLPTRNKFRAERLKSTRKCALCKLHREIKEEVNAIFRFR
jgi:hypothetical protein